MRHTDVRTAGAALVALLALAACGSDSPKHEAGPTTTTTVAAGADWSRPCTGSSNGPGGEDDGADTFGPLGSEPSIVVDLPRTTDGDPFVAWGRLRGATAVAAAPGESSKARSSMVSVVDDDGTLRWTRCFDGTVTAIAAGQGADVVLVAVRPLTGIQTYTKDGATFVLDASDGAERERLDEVDGIYATAGTRALVGHIGLDSDVPKVLALVDLTTGKRTAVTPPPASLDVVGRLELAGDGTLRFDGSVWRDRAWVPDPSPPTVVAFDLGADDQALVSRTGDTVHWRVALERPPLEGADVVQDDDTAVAWTCGERDAQGMCRLDLVGVDVASGRVLWRQTAKDREQQVLGVGDDDAFLTESGSTWTMRRMRTGEPLGGQRWPDHDTFLQGCCGDADHYRVERFGGTVLVLHQTEVRIWFPRASSHPTVHVQP